MGHIVELPIFAVGGDEFPAVDADGAIAFMFPAERGVALDLGATLEDGEQTLPFLSG